MGHHRRGVVRIDRQKGGAGFQNGQHGNHEIHAARQADRNDIAGACAAQLQLHRQPVGARLQLPMAESRALLRGAPCPDHCRGLWLQSRPRRQSARHAHRPLSQIPRQPARPLWPAPALQAHPFRIRQHVQIRQRQPHRSLCQLIQEMAEMAQHPLSLGLWHRLGIIFQHQLRAGIAIDRQRQRHGAFLMQLHPPGGPSAPQPPHPRPKAVALKHHHRVKQRHIGRQITALAHLGKRGLFMGAHRHGIAAHRPQQIIKPDAIGQAQMQGQGVDETSHHTRRSRHQITPGSGDPEHRPALAAPARDQHPPGHVDHIGQCCPGPGRARHQITAQLRAQLMMQLAFAPFCNGPFCNGPDCNGPDRADVAGISLQIRKPL